MIAMLIVLADQALKLHHVQNKTDDGSNYMNMGRLLLPTSSAVVGRRPSALTENVFSLHFVDSTG